MHDWLFVDGHIKEQVAPLHPHVQMDEFPSEVIDSTIDVLSYELWTDWIDLLTTSRAERGERKAESRIKITLKIIDGIEPLIQNIVLDARTVIIDSVFVDGTRADFEKSTRELDITLPTGITGGDQIEIDIYYAMGSDTRGVYAYSNFEVDTLSNALEPIVFTFCQPQDARRWYPCNDKPHDKAFFTAHCRVPTGFTVVSNGVPIDSIADTDSSTSWQTWQHEEEMPTYLFTLNASRFHLYEQEFVSVSGDTIPIYNYHWLEDHEGEEFNAVNALRNIPAMFNVFEDRFGPYRFDTYGHVTVAPIRIGGMEHQSMSTINRVWLRGTAECWLRPRGCTPMDRRPGNVCCMGRHLAQRRRSIVV